MSARVQGHCPVCGRTSLFLGDGGYVTCGAVECPEPDAASTILEDRETEHVVTLREVDFTIRHPLRERLRDELMDCTLNEHLRHLDGPPAKPGRYRARMSAFGNYTWEAIDA